MKKRLKKKGMILILLAGAVVIIWGICQILYLRKAHSTFEDYYAFRGCTQPVEIRSDYGICKVGNGQTIKIVKFQNKWYLDGDLPCGFLCF